MSDLPAQTAMAVSFRSRYGGTEWLRVPLPALFLRLEIDRDLTVRMDPCFAYPVLTDFFPVGSPLPFTAEFLDADGTTVGCTSLREDCFHCGGGCWPKRVRQTISLPEGARRFRVVHGGDVIHEQTIPDPPKVDVTCAYDQEHERVQVKWQAIAPGGSEKEAADVWYLVQYRARGAWRGLAPRTQDREASVDVKRLSLPATVPVRVLATSGIATGVGECSAGEGPGGKPDDGQLVTTAGEPSDQPIAVAGVLQVKAVDNGGRSLAGADIRWFDDAGRELSRGRDLHVSDLGVGEHVVHAVAVETGGRPLTRSFVLNRPTDDDPCHLTSADHPSRYGDSGEHIHPEGESH